jgi:hypothetical protein
MYERNSRNPNLLLVELTLPVFYLCDVYWNPLSYKVKFVADEISYITESRHLYSKFRQTLVTDLAEFVFQAWACPAHVTVSCIIIMVREMLTTQCIRIIKQILLCKRYLHCPFVHMVLFWNRGLYVVRDCPHYSFALNVTMWEFLT